MSHKELTYVRNGMQIKLDINTNRRMGIMVNGKRYCKKNLRRDRSNLRPKLIKTFQELYKGSGAGGIQPFSPVH